jgi:hypothetical protein
MLLLLALRGGFECVGNSSLVVFVDARLDGDADEDFGGKRGRKRRREEGSEGAGSRLLSGGRGGYRVLRGFGKRILLSTFPCGQQIVFFRLKERENTLTTISSNSL